MNRFHEVVRRSHLPALDGLRAVAVAVVIVGHANYPVRGFPADLGVSAFFVLSGFLITRLLIRERDNTGAVSLRNFYLRRTMRIFPAYYAFLAFSILLDLRQGQHWTRSLVVSGLTYTVNYFNALHHHPVTSIAHAWSLAVEEQFYLLWPIAFIALIRGGRRRVIAGVSLLAVAALTWRSILGLGAHVDVAYLYNAFDTRFDNLAVGCLLALIADYAAVGRFVDRTAERAWYPLLTIGALALSRFAAPAAYHFSLGFTIDAVLVATLIAQLLVLNRAPPWSWLDLPVVRYLGTISYPLYLYHAWGASIGRHLHLARPGLVFMAGVAATIALAMGSYHVIERPFLSLKRRFEPASSNAHDSTRGALQPGVSIPADGILQRAHPATARTVN